MISCSHWGLFHIPASKRGPAVYQVLNFGYDFD
jgi:hypothetical protein